MKESMKPIPETELIEMEKTFQAEAKFNCMGGMGLKLIGELQLWKERAETQVEEEQAKYEHLLGLLRDTKMKHGLCEPRTRKACTACNAQDELNRTLEAWKGFTMRLSDVRS